MSESAIDAAAERGVFKLDDGIAYFGAASIAPLLKAVDEAGRSALDRWGRPWSLDQETWFDDADAVRALVGSLLGVGASDIAIVPSVSYGMEIAARNLVGEGMIESGREILTLDRQFPSNHYPWRRVAQEAGASVVVVPEPSGGDWTSGLLERIGSKTAVVSIPNAHWSDGAVIDVARVGEACRSVGAALCLDLTQSAGVLPTDLRAIGADFAVMCGYKWLLGPYGTSYFYAAPERQNGEPLEVNWLNRANSSRFDLLSDYTDEMRPGARRYDAGEHTNYLALPMAKAALEQVTRWGPARLSSALRGLTERIVEIGERMGWRATPVGVRSPHIVGLRHDRVEAVAAAKSLSEAGVKVSVRDGRMRVAPHLHIGDGDINRFEVALRGVSG